MRKPSLRQKRWALRCVAVAGSVSLSGCAALPLAALGSVADISSSVIGTGSEVFSSGKLDSVEYATFADVERSVPKTAHELGFDLVYSDFGPTYRDYTISDSQEKETSIEITMMTPKLCAVRINVGFFGSEPLARLMLRRIRARLPQLTRGPTSRGVDLRELNDIIDAATAD